MPLSQRYIFRFWLPLALMWVMMALEQPILAAVIARLPQPKEQLAAFGITFSLALLIEGPIIMLLTASTALAKGSQSYGQLLRFTTLLSVSITALHLIIALTPAYAFLVDVLIGAPKQLVEPSRQTFLIMFPWSAVVAYRRLWQGVMIRFGYTDQVGLTMIMRLIATASVAIIGGYYHILPGAPLAGLSLIAGVITGAIVSYIYVHPILRHGPLSQLEPPEDRISLRYLTKFYIPLALTNVINFVGRPILAFGLSRGQLPLESLALWPVLGSLAFIFRSIGFGYQEVVVALAHHPNARLALRRFALMVGGGAAVLMAIIAITPLSDLWYGVISGLPPELMSMAPLPTLIIAPTALLAFTIALQRGLLVHARRTRPISFAVTINVGVLILVMLAGLKFFTVPGVTIAATAFTLSLLAESSFLGIEARGPSRMSAPTLSR
jgi:uncharacterized membrane protein